MNDLRSLLLGTLRAPASTRRKRRSPIGVSMLEGRLLLAGDITAPSTVAVVSPNTLNGTGYYTSSPERVDLIASDPDSPIGLATYYSVDGAEFVAGNTLLLGEGVHNVRFFSVDQSGNREALQSLNFAIDSTAPVVTASASPSSLWPPNHKFVPVTVSGHVSDASGGVPGFVSYRVVDEYGQVQPSGTARVDANGNYSFVVRLQSSRLGQDKDGRQYTILVAATDEAGNSGSTATSVVVPHDQGHHGGHNQGDGNGNLGSGQGKGGKATGGKNGKGGDHGVGKRQSIVVVVPPDQSGGGDQGGDNGNGKGDKGNGGSRGHGKGHG